MSLAPKKEFFKTWRHNRGIIDEKTNNEYYMKEFCHRHIVAARLELTLCVEVLEVKIDNFNEEVIDRLVHIKNFRK